MEQHDRGTAAAVPLVPWRLTICGLDELAAFADAGVDHVLSILDPDWPDPPAFAAYGPHRRVVERFEDVVTGRDDTAPPAVGHVEAILRFADGLRQERARHVLVHCHAGVSRSTAAAAILLACHQPGREADAFAEVARLRPRSWPNARMLAIADRLLRRDGALTAALRDHRARITAADPDLADVLGPGDRAPDMPELG